MPRGRKSKKTLDSLPNKIKCVKCSKMCGVREDILKERIKLHGSLDKLLSEYFCRGCRKGTSYVVNDQPVVSNAGLSPAMQAIRDCKMWWQQPGFTLFKDKIGVAVGPEMTYEMVNGEVVFVPVRTV